MKTEKQSIQKSRVGRVIFRIFMILLISLFIGGTIYTVNARRVLGNQMPMPFGVGLSVVLSDSMSPTLSTNDLVIVKEAASYHVGDIVVYQRNRSSELIIHRIIEINDDQYILQGDANIGSDDPISLSEIKGKEIASVPYIGLLVRLLQSTVGKIVVIALAAYLLHRSRAKEQTEDDDKLDRIKEEIRRLKAQEEDRLNHQSDGPDPDPPADDPKPH